MTPESPTQAMSLEQQVTELIAWRRPTRSREVAAEVIALVAEHFAEMLEASATNYEASCWMDLAATLIRNGGVQS